MAGERRGKEGLDYFSLDVHLDDKFQLLEAEYGLKGFAVVVKLYQRIYGGLGYYCEWNDEVALLFGKSCGLGGSAVSEIVASAVRRRIFDAHLFEQYGILTSSGIQKRYFEATERRKSVKCREEYLLISTSELPSNVCVMRARCVHHVNILSQNVDILDQNAYAQRQSKAKESKEEKREEEEEEDARAREDQDSPWFRFVKEYEQNIGVIPANGYALEALQGFFEILGPGVMSEAIKATALKHPQNPHRYLQAICQEWVQKEIRTLEQAKAAVMDHNHRERGEKRKHFIPPSLEEVQEYISARGYPIDAQNFIDYYTAVGWKVNGGPLEDWRAKIRTWASREKQFTPKPNSGAAHGYIERDYSEKDFEPLFFDVMAEYASDGE